MMPSSADMKITMSLLKKIERIRIRLHKRFQDFYTSYPGFNCKVIDKSSFLYMHDEIFTREVYRFISSRPNPFIIDCGANIGLATIYFKRLYPEAKVVAFEPDPAIFSTLQENLESANVSRGVSCVQACVTSTPGEVTFYSDHADGGSLIAASSNKKPITVKAVSLAEYLTEKVDFLKIDIEGAEYDVLNSVKDKLGGVENIFVEYHSFSKDRQTLAEILTILSEANFRYYLEPGGSHSKNPFLERQQYEGMDMQVNIFGYR